MVTLILGGARSGKSAHALRLAEAAGPRRCYVATAQAWDDEMADRIARHQAERGQGWRTVEAPLDLVGELVGQDGLPMVIDCLTLWLSNLMHHERDVAAETDRLVAALADAGAPVFLVSNEVGLSIVPENALARRFRDEQGRLNQRIAAEAEQVFLVAAGLPLRLK